MDKAILIIKKERNGLWIYEMKLLCLFLSIFLGISTVHARSLPFTWQELSDRLEPLHCIPGIVQQIFFMSGTNGQCTGSPIALDLCRPCDIKPCLNNGTCTPHPYRAVGCLDMPPHTVETAPYFSCECADNRLSAANQCAYLFPQTSSNTANPLPFARNFTMHVAGANFSARPENQAIKQDLGSLFEVTEDQVVLYDVRQGSIVVQFSINCMDSASVDLSNNAALVNLANTSHVFFAVGSLGSMGTPTFVNDGNSNANAIITGVFVTIFVVGCLGMMFCVHRRRTFWKKRLEDNENKEKAKLVKPVVVAVAVSKQPAVACKSCRMSYK